MRAKTIAFSFVLIGLGLTASSCRGPSATPDAWMRIPAPPPPLAVGQAPPLEFRGANNPKDDRFGDTDCNSPVIWDGDECIIFNSAGHPWRNAGPDPFGPAESSVSITFDNEVNGGRWFESVWREEDGTLYSWYHHEPNDVCPQTRPKRHLTAPKIGAARSIDGGLTWKDLGIVLTAPPGFRCDTENFYFAGGNGDFSVILDGEKEYFYFFISTYGDLSEQGVAVARMAYADRDAPVGKVWKWHDGGWREPGVGGRLTPIFGIVKDWHAKDANAFWGPSIHWNTYLETYVILLNRTMDSNWKQEGIYVTYNPDLSDPTDWTPPAKILDRADLLSRLRRHSAWYPQVIGVEKGETDKRAGRLARLYVMGESYWEIEFRKEE